MVGHESPVAVGRGGRPFDAAQPDAVALHRVHDVDLFVSVTVYEDGQEVDTFPLSVPYLGQALAAAEKSAGTL